MKKRISEAQRQKLRKYFTERKNIEMEVVKTASRQGVVFGSSSVKRQIKHARKPRDRDLFVKKGARGFARKVERKLDKKSKGNFYQVSPAKKKGVYKIKSRIGGKTIMDVSKKPKNLRTKRIGGQRYTTLGTEKKMAMKSLKRKSSKFRHGKDREKLLLIKTFKKKGKTPRGSTKKVKSMGRKKVVRRKKK